jgi:hypothetical protein
MSDTALDKFMMKMRRVEFSNTTSRLVQFATHEVLLKELIEDGLEFRNGSTIAGTPDTLQASGTVFS